jgi:putative membrane protein
MATDETVATGTRTDGTPVPGTVGPDDVELLVGAHQVNLAGRAAGRVAVERAASDEVRRLGTMLLDDHTSLDAAVVAVADDLGVELPDGPTPEQHDDLTRAVALSGADFDATWLTTQVAAHRAALALGERARASASHTDVRELAQAAAPILAHHLETALAVAEALGVAVDVGAPGAAVPPTDGRAAGAGVPAAGSRGSAGAPGPGSAGAPGVAGLVHRATEAARRLDARSAVVGLTVGLLLGRRSRHH